MEGHRPQSSILMQKAKQNKKRKYKMYVIENWIFLFCFVSMNCFMQ